MKLCKDTGAYQVFYCNVVKNIEHITHAQIFWSEIITWYLKKNVSNSWKTDKRWKNGWLWK